MNSLPLQAPQSTPKSPDETMPPTKERDTAVAHTTPSPQDFLSPAPMATRSPLARAAESLMQHRPEQAALPIHVETVQTQPDMIQASLLEQQASGISETILLHYQNQNEENEPRKYRGIRPNTTNVIRGRGSAPRIIGVTSAVAGEGKTTVALHIAMALARNSYKNICLLDLGLNREVLCSRLGVPPPAHGVIDVLEWNGETEPDFLPLPLLRSDDQLNLYLMPAGRQPVRAERTAHSPRVGDIFNIARAWTDIIVVDLPSVNSGNILPLRDHLDGIVMVVRAGVTPKDVVTGALDRVGRERVLGVVLNGQESPLPGWLQGKFGGVVG